MKHLDHLKHEIKEVFFFRYKNLILKTKKLK